MFFKKIIIALFLFLFFTNLFSYSKSKIIEDNFNYKIEISDNKNLLPKSFNKYNCIHNLYYDIFATLNPENITLIQKTNIMSYICTYLQLDYKIDLYIKNFRLNKDLKISLFESNELAIKGQNNILLVTNYNVKDNKILTAKDNKENVYKKLYEIKNGLFISANSLFQSEKEKEFISKNNKNSLANLYLFDEIVSNDAKIEDLLKKAISENNKNTTGSITLAQYYISKIDFINAERILIDAEKAANIDNKKDIDNAKDEFEISRFILFPPIKKISYEELINQNIFEHINPGFTFFRATEYETTFIWPGNIKQLTNKDKMSLIKQMKTNNLIEGEDYAKKFNNYAEIKEQRKVKWTDKKGKSIKVIRSTRLYIPNEFIKSISNDLKKGDQIDAKYWLIGPYSDIDQIFYCFIYEYKKSNENMKTDKLRQDIPKFEAAKIEELKTIKKGESVSFSNIIFYPDLDKIKEESFFEIDKIAETLNQRSNISIEIIGHTNNTNKPDMELALSKKRAEMVKNYLIKKGVNPNRIKASGYGSKFTSNLTIDEANRRVEFKITDVK
jgi:outer membrane protein OmpA-like peptidoglycan-associated protein